MPEALTFWQWTLLACLACGLTLALSTWDTATTRRETALLFLLGVAYAGVWITAATSLADSFQPRTTDTSHMSITTTKGEK